MIGVLALLSGAAQAIAAFFGRLRDQTLVRAGEDRIAREAAENVERLAKKAVEKRAGLDALSDADADERLRRASRLD